MRELVHPALRLVEGPFARIAVDECGQRRAMPGAGVDPVAHLDSREPTAHQPSPRRAASISESMTLSSPLEPGTT